MYSLLQFLIICRGERNSVWKLRRPRLLDKEKQLVTRRERPWIFFSVSCCSSNALVHWFHCHSCTYQNGGRNFRLSIHRLWQVFDFCLFLFTSPCQLTFEPESPSYFCLVSEREHIRFRWFHACAEDLGSQFFVVIFIRVVIHVWVADLQRVV